MFLGIIRPFYGSGKIRERSITYEEIRLAIELNKPRWLLVHGQPRRHLNLFNDASGETTDGHRSHRHILKGNRMTEDDRWERDLKLELYKIAVKTRAEEIDRFWQRSNYLLVLNLGMAAGYCSLRGSDRPFAALLAVAGIIAAILWFVVNWSGRFWHILWEERARLAELSLAPNANLISASPESNNEAVRNHISREQGEGTVFWLRKKYRELIPFKSTPSVSEAIALLSLAFIVFWIWAFEYTAVSLMVYWWQWLSGSEPSVDSINVR